MGEMQFIVIVRAVTTIEADEADFPGKKEEREREREKRGVGRRTESQLQNFGQLAPLQNRPHILMCNILSFEIIR